MQVSKGEDDVVQSSSSSVPHVTATATRITSSPIVPSTNTITTPADAAVAVTCAVAAVTHAISTTGIMAVSIKKVYLSSSFVCYCTCLYEVFPPREVLLFL